MKRHFSFESVLICCSTTVASTGSCSAATVLELPNLTVNSVTLAISKIIIIIMMIILIKGKFYCINFLYVSVHVLQKGLTKPCHTTMIAIISHPYRVSRTQLLFILLAPWYQISTRYWLIRKLRYRNWYWEEKKCYRNNSSLHSWSPKAKS